jgi:hypothetical protein
MRAHMRDSDRIRRAKVRLRREGLDSLYGYDGVRGKRYR